MARKIDQYGIGYEEPDVPVRTLDNRSPDTRTLDSLGAGEPINLDRGGQVNSYSIFNNALMEMLKKAQGMGTRPMQQQAIDLSTQQAERGMAQATPGMSPSQQSAIRSAGMGALSPSIQGAQERAQTFSEQLGGFKDVLNTVQSMGQSLQDQQFKAQEASRKLVNDALTQLGSAAFEGVDSKELAQLEKSAGYPTGYLTRAAKTLKQQEIEAKNAAAALKASQAGDNILPGDNPQLYSGLNSKTATAVRTKAGQFKTEPIVANFNVVNEGYNFLKSIPNNTKNPADNQGAIYAFAKIMDPNSVVREGEYATVQKYSQSWLESFGFNAARVVNNQEFLTPQALQNMKDTVERKYNASKTNYENVYRQYAQGINNLTGRQDGEKFLVDYGQAYNAPVIETGGQNIIIAPDGQEVEIIEEAPQPIIPSNKLNQQRIQYLA